MAAWVVPAIMAAGALAKWAGSGNPGTATDYSGARSNYTNSMSKAQNAFGRDASAVQGMAQQSINNASADSILANTNKFTQDANAYEKNQVVQDVQGIYGDDPLGASAKSNVTGQLALLARQNRASGLAAAQQQAGLEQGAYNTAINTGTEFAQGKSQLATQAAQNVLGIDKAQADANKASQDNRGVVRKVLSKIF